MPVLPGAALEGATLPLGVNPDDLPEPEPDWSSKRFTFTPRDSSVDVFCGAGGAAEAVVTAGVVAVVGTAVVDEDADDAKADVDGEDVADADDEGEET